MMRIFCMFCLLAVPCAADYLSSLSSFIQDSTSITKIGVSNLHLEESIFFHLSASVYPPRSYLQINRQVFLDSYLEELKRLEAQYSIKYTFWRANELYLSLETTDLLILDEPTYHHYLDFELGRFAPKVRKYLCIKNATGPWEYQDDDFHCVGGTGYPSSLYRGCRGPRLAVLQFLRSHPEWEEIAQDDYTVLKRISSVRLEETMNNTAVNAVIDRHMILCTGPSFNRSDLLKAVTEADTGIIPFKKVFVATNDARIVPLQFYNLPSHNILIPQQTVQLDCTNCILQTLKDAANDPDVLDEDIILFKHETVFVNDLHLFKQAIGKLLEGYDMVARSWIVPNSRTKGTDAFLIKVAAVRALLPSLNLITEFPSDGTFCEEYLTQYIFNQVHSCYDIPYYHSNGWNTELGLYHIPSEAQATSLPWNLENYHTLY